MLEIKGKRKLNATMISVLLSNRIRNCCGTHCFDSLLNMNNAGVLSLAHENWVFIPSDHGTWVSAQLKIISI